MANFAGTKNRQMERSFLFSSVVLTFSGLLITGLIPHRAKAVAIIILVAANAVLTSLVALSALVHGPFEMTISSFGFFGDIAVRVDALAAWFMLIVNFISVNGAIYGLGYTRMYKEQHANLSFHWMLYLLFHSAMIWVCMVQNSMAFLVVWELMSLSSLLLLLFEHKQQAVLDAGVKYLVQMHLGVLCLTVAFVWVYSETGSFDFTAIGHFFGSHPNIWLFLLFFVGFGIKAGMIPLHTWLPYAHPAAPSHVSAVMSGVMVKLGIYGILRVVTFLKADYLLLGEVVLFVSVVTALYGILNAAVHRDVKRMLAYCTIENIGIIGSGVGLGLMGLGSGSRILVILGFGGALLHTLNHSLFKSLLFFSAGSIYQQTHTRNMEKLGGLLKRMPKTGLLFLVGALAIGGLPPFNGFVSEFLLYSGYLEGIRSFGVAQVVLMVFAVSSLAIIGGLSVLTFTKAFGVIFLGSERSAHPHHAEEVPLVMRIPQYLTVVAMFSVALFPGRFLGWVLHPVQLFMPAGLAVDTSLVGSRILLMQEIAFGSLLLMGLIALIYTVRRFVMAPTHSLCGCTWGCGYVKPSPVMQYTGKSFSKTLGKLLNFIILKRKNYLEVAPGEIFPAPRSHSSYYEDMIEEKLFRGSVDGLLRVLYYFRFVQNGKTQFYVLYGIVFILLIFIGTLFHMI